MYSEIDHIPDTEEFPEYCILCGQYYDNWQGPCDGRPEDNPTGEWF